MSYLTATINASSVAAANPAQLKYGGGNADIDVWSITETG
jgi:hypothetical protein